MSISSVKEYLSAWGKESDVLEFDVSSATVALAAEALGITEARIAKSLAFAQGSTCILVVTAGDARIHNRKFKDQFGMKAKMLDVETTYLLTGHPVGGVCPFALFDESISVYLDESLKRFETVFPACGSPNSAIELTIDELSTLSKYTAWVDVCSGWDVL